MRLILTTEHGGHQSQALDVPVAFQTLPPGRCAHGNERTRPGDGTDGAVRWHFLMAYADEPHANSGDTLVLTADRRALRGASIVSRQQLPDGRLQLVTEQDTRDNERPARIRSVYVIGERAASLQKLVRYDDGEFYQRHIDEWVR